MLVYKKYGVMYGNRPIFCTSHELWMSFKDLETESFRLFNHDNPEIRWNRYYDFMRSELGKLGCGHKILVLSDKKF